MKGPIYIFFFAAQIIHVAPTPGDIRTAVILTLVDDDTESKFNYGSFQWHFPNQLQENQELYNI